MGFVDDIQKAFQEGWDRGMQAAERLKPGVYFMVRFEGRTGFIGPFPKEDRKIYEGALRKIEGVEVIETKVY